MGNAYFEHRILHKYTRVARGQDGVEVKSIIDLMRYVQGVRVVRGMGLSLLDHFLVLCNVRLVGPWIKRRDVVEGAGRIRSEKLREHQCREE